MPVDKEQWIDPFFDLPAWDCPTCGRGRLRHLKDTEASKETGPSEVTHSSSDFDPESLTYRFATLLQCDFQSCLEVASVCGSKYPTHGSLVLDGTETDCLVDAYEVKAVAPAPMPIKLPKDLPKAVSDPIFAGAAVYWTSPESAANHIRQSVEALMDAKRINKTHSTRRGRMALSLHSRIKLFEAKDKPNAELLLAVKWLGNSGSHTGGLTREDVIDAFDMIEHVLENLYGTTKKELIQKAKQVNRKKGPVKRRLYN